MKKTPHTISIKKGGAHKKAASHAVPVTLKRRGVTQSKAAKYSDGLVRIYHREEEDIDRFAAFAKKLIER